MAYTGTGSSADPAIPSTITELYKIITDARNGNVNGNTRGPYYIKLTQDIDCADDPNYIGYAGRLSLDAPSNNNALRICKIYADTKKYIRGLTVKDSVFIDFWYQEGLGSEIRNIDFIDCFFKPTENTSSTSATMFYAYNTPSSAVIKNSTMSISCYGYNYGNINRSCLFVRNVAFSNCSVYVKYNSTYSIIGDDTFIDIGYFYNGNLMKNNIFIFDSFYLTCSSSWSYPIIRASYTTEVVQYNSFIFKNPKITNSSSTLGILNGAYNYLAFLNPTVASGISTPLNIQTFRGTATTIFATDSSAYGTVITKGSDSSGVGYWLTLDELKSEQKLLDIGFVP